MKPILVAYATTEGQTRKVATHVADTLRALGCTVDLVNVGTPAADSVSPVYAAAILAGSLHLGAHQSALADFARRNRDWLNACPAAFLSVSLTAGLADETSRAECRAAAQQFLDATGFAPGIVLPVAGALPYTQYDWFRRFAMKTMAGKHGGDTDTSRDFEYTDWAALDAFAKEYVAAASLDAGR
jgi:menaquinone-dependent protoporphyrinogen oxidase